ncbi:hypothetical protein MOC16_gp074 [Klebsiella phage vB_KpM_FBKp24]|uniref:Uncharacterized protein n=1 Tax=Klebsiella phage vB_KpM_FBKp24 TaxID=2801834 RepID=A0A7U0GBN8_9CAUD|nr:hypothetical protein [Klebsiella pneumoniae]YP_010298976.1 hypothetical protein MOC16_gp074 [Klebsiella phage vB_KpM_FBKp24]QQV92190.1 hypothetical protein vBKpMFBKp24_339 [Klebsiella phage vB_KpM_FBKp24]
MLKDEIELLSGQAHQYTSAFKTTLKDETDINTFNAFVSQYYSVTAQPLLVTKEQLFSVQNEVHSRDILVNYVFGLRFTALSLFTRKEVSLIAECFANANANRPVANEASGLTALPEDAQMWKVKYNELVLLYEANLWVLPLMALGFIFPSFSDENIVQ